MNTPRKVRMPDGKGGWKETETTMEPVTVKTDAKKTQGKLQSAQEEDFFARVGACTAALNRFLEIYRNDHELSDPEIVAAVYLENINNRTYFPEGVKQYDKICSDVWDWFQAHR